MNDEDWEYFGRDGPRGVYEIFRALPHIDPPEARFATMQRLKRTLLWESAAQETALRNEWLRGDFDFDDNRLTLAETKTLVDNWSKSNVWPGRD